MVSPIRQGDVRARATVQRIGKSVRRYGRSDTAFSKIASSFRA